MSQSSRKSSSSSSSLSYAERLRKANGSTSISTKEVKVKAEGRENLTSSSTSMVPTLSSSSTQSTINTHISTSTSIKEPQSVSNNQKSQDGKKQTTLPKAQIPKENPWAERSRMKKEVEISVPKETPTSKPSASNAGKSKDEIAEERGGLGDGRSKGEKETAEGKDMDKGKERDAAATGNGDDKVKKEMKEPSSTGGKNQKGSKSWADIAGRNQRATAQVATSNTSTSLSTPSISSEVAQLNFGISDLSSIVTSKPQTQTQPPRQRKASSSSSSNKPLINQPQSSDPTSADQGIDSLRDLSADYKAETKASNISQTNRKVSTGTSTGTELSLGDSSLEREERRSDPTDVSSGSIGNVSASRGRKAGAPRSRRKSKSGGNPNSNNSNSNHSNSNNSTSSNSASGNATSQVRGRNRTASSVPPFQSEGITLEEETIPTLPVVNGKETEAYSTLWPAPSSSHRSLSISSSNCKGKNKDESNPTSSLSPTQALSSNQVPNAGSRASFSSSTSSSSALQPIASISDLSTTVSERSGDPTPQAIPSTATNYSELAGLDLKILGNKNEKVKTKNGKIWISIVPDVTHSSGTTSNTTSSSSGTHTSSTGLSSRRNRRNKMEASSDHDHWEARNRKGGETSAIDSAGKGASTSTTRHPGFSAGGLEEEVETSAGLDQMRKLVEDLRLRKQRSHVGSNSIPEGQVEVSGQVIEREKEEATEGGEEEKVYYPPPWPAYLNPHLNPTFNQAPNPAFFEQHGYYNIQNQDQFSSNFSSPTTPFEQIQSPPPQHPQCVDPYYSVPAHLNMNMNMNSQLPLIPHLSEGSFGLNNPSMRFAPTGPSSRVGRDRDSSGSRYQTHPQGDRERHSFRSGGNERNTYEFKPKNFQRGHWKGDQLEQNQNRGQDRFQHSCTEENRARSSIGAGDKFQQPQPYPQQHRPDLHSQSQPQASMSTFQPDQIPNQVQQPVSPSSPSHQLLVQIEFYFSARNLEGDFYLRSCMDSQGWVMISVVSTFNRVKKLTNDFELIRNTLMFSQVLEVDFEGRRVRKKWGWEEYVLENQKVGIGKEDHLQADSGNHQLNHPSTSTILHQNPQNQYRSQNSSSNVESSYTSSSHSSNPTLNLRINNHFSPSVHLPPSSSSSAVSGSGSNSNSTSDLVPTSMHNHLHNNVTPTSLSSYSMGTGTGISSTTTPTTEDNNSKLSTFSSPPSTFSLGTTSEEDQVGDFTEDEEDDNDDAKDEVSFFLQLVQASIGTVDTMKY